MNITYADIINARDELKADLGSKPLDLKSRIYFLEKIISDYKVLVEDFDSDPFYARFLSELNHCKSQLVKS